MPWFLFHLCRIACGLKHLSCVQNETGTNHKNLGCFQHVHKEYPDVRKVFYLCAGVKVSHKPDTYSLIHNLHVIEFCLKPVEKEKPSNSKRRADDQLHVLWALGSAFPPEPSPPEQDAAAPMEWLVWMLTAALPCSSFHLIYSHYFSLACPFLGYHPECTRDSFSFNEDLLFS